MPPATIIENSSMKNANALLVSFRTFGALALPATFSIYLMTNEGVTISAIDVKAVLEISLNLTSPSFSVKNPQTIAAAFLLRIVPDYENIVMEAIHSLTILTLDSFQSFILTDMNLNNASPYLSEHSSLFSSNQAPMP